MDCDVPSLLVAVHGHDDGAGGIGKRDGGIEDEAAAAALGDAVGLAVDVQPDSYLRGVAPGDRGRDDCVRAF